MVLFKPQSRKAWNGPIKDKGESSTGRYKALRKYKGIQFHDDDLEEDRAVVDLEWPLKRWTLVPRLSTVTNGEGSIGHYVQNDHRECVEFEAHRKPREK